MENSKARVRALLEGEIPDRPPLFDLLRNDKVIEYFTGERLSVENGADLVYKAYEPAIDATRPKIKSPNAEGTRLLEDGRKERLYRWTIWTETRHYPDVEAYRIAKRKVLASFDPVWRREDQTELEKQLENFAAAEKRLGEVFLFKSIPGPKLMQFYGEIGLEDFSYYMADCIDIIDELLECNTLKAISRAEHLPDGHGMEAGFLGDDIAFHTGPLFHPRWLAKHYFPRLGRVIDAYHEKGVKVLFHSDGNLNLLLDPLVEAGIDGLNPIEVLAGMDVGAIHSRYPHLFLAGGIDVSQLLPFGSPAEIRNTVRKTIAAAEGRLLVGSTTELNDSVPLENFLALRDTVLDFH